MVSLGILLRTGTLSRSMLHTYNPTVTNLKNLSQTDSLTMQLAQLTRLLSHSSARAASTFVKQPMLVHGQYKDLCAKTWSSEPGAYPIIAILAFACVGSAFYGNYLLFGHTDVQMDPAKRGSIVRYWGKKA